MKLYAIPGIYSGYNNPNSY